MTTSASAPAIGATPSKEKTVKTKTKSKVNIIPWRSEEQPGLRIMWTKAIAWFLTLGWAYMTHRAYVSNRLGTDAWFGAAIIVVLAAAVYGLYWVIRYNVSWQISALMLVTGIAIGATTVLLCFVLPSDMLLSMIIGGLVVLAGLALFATTTFTKWWPHGIKAHNRGE